MVGKNKIITFLLSFIPGVGHLYLGLNKRGLQFLIGGFACISLIPPYPMVFPFVLAVVWFYGLFDALQKATLLNHYSYDPNRQPFDGAEEDGISPHPGRWDDDPIRSLFKENAIPPLWLGIGLIVLGIIVLSQIVIPELWYWLFQKQTSSILLALFMIGFGIWQIGKHIGKR